MGFRSWSWQNLAGFGGTWQNMADCRQIAARLPQIAVRLPSRGRSRGRSLVVESVGTGGRV